MDPNEGITYWERSDKPDFPPLYDSVNGNEKQSKTKLFQRVNRELLSFKAFYFFFYGAIGALFPFLSLYYKHLWLSASQAGLLVGLRPIVQSLAAPLWAMLADKCKIKKIVLLVGLCGWLLTRTSILLVSPGEKPLSCIENSTALEQMRKRSLDNTGYSSFGDTSKEISERRLERSAPMDRKTLHENKDFERVSRQQNHLRFSTKKTFDEPLFLGSHESSNPTPFSIEITSRSALRDTTITKGVEMKKELDSADKTVQASMWDLNDPRESIKTWYTFVLIFMITVVGDLFSAPAQTMANTATLQGLKADTHKYGFQRCFGSIGWGCSAFVVGMLVSLNHDENLSCADEGLDDVNYTPCFYAFGILMLFALVVALFFKFDEARGVNKEPVGLCMNLRQELDFLTCFVLFTAFLSGFNMGFIQTFLFWHLHSLGGTQQLFSIITAFNAVGEMIGFLLSVKLIERFGHLKVMSIGFAAYAVRLLVCGLVKNPWLVLTVEMLKAFTSSGIWASLLSFIGVSGSSAATLLSLLHMLYWGLGYGGGGMLGGVLMQYIGATKVFVGLAIASLLNVLVILLIVNLKCCPKKKKGVYLPLASDGEDEEDEDEDEEDEDEEEEEEKELES